MNPAEEYEFKRQNFIENTRKCFMFLVKDFGYSEPIYKFYQQENGTIIEDEFRFENIIVDRLLIVSNAYHPYDYGFEVNFYRPSVASSYEHREMRIYIKKEEQDLEQTYIEQAAIELRKYREVLTGVKWFD
jgi:hypothetical protein